MKKINLLVVLFAVHLATFAQPIYLSKTGEASFFSETPLENIDAHSKIVTSVLNTTSKEVVFKIKVRTFKFEKALMEEHFNEKYLESDKYSDATFIGKINETIDFTKDGVYQITATGKLNIHGIAKDRTEKGTLTIKNGQISISASFIVTLKDFKIEVPQLVMQNIAETIAVKVSADYMPYKK